MRSKVERKIIFKAYTGSHLYGTNTPSSDEDFVGVFLPGTDDMFSLENCPTEWTMNQKFSEGPRNEKGDVDCKLFSLKQFMNLAMQGQPAQLEMLFTPEDKIIEKTPEWDCIKLHLPIFLSRNGIRPFVGFALAQSHKASIKGENLNKLSAIAKWGEGLGEKSVGEPLMSFLAVTEVGSGKWGIVNTDIEVNAITNDFGALLVEVAGRKYDINIKTKTFLESIGLLIERYGTRTKSAAQSGYDYKSLMHAFRLLSEAEEFLKTGKITMPRPDAEFLKNIKAQKVDIDFNAEITSRLDKIRQEVEPVSPLPVEPNRTKIVELYQHIMLGFL